MWWCLWLKLSSILIEKDTITMCCLSCQNYMFLNVSLYTFKPKSGWTVQYTLTSHSSFQSVIIAFLSIPLDLSTATTVTLRLWTKARGRPDCWLVLVCHNLKQFPEADKTILILSLIYWPLRWVSKLILVENFILWNLIYKWSLTCGLNSNQILD